METLLTTAIQEMFKQGLGWVLFALAVVALAYVYRENQKFQTASSTSRDALYEKRIIDHTEILNALNQSTLALDTMRVSVEARTNAVANLTQAFAELSRDTEHDRENITEILRDINRRLEELGVARLRTGKVAI